MTSLYRSSASTVRFQFNFLSIFFVFLVSHRCGFCQSTSPEPPATDANEVEAGHSFHGEAFDEGPRQAAYLMQGMGNVHWKISTKSPMAQRFFDQAIGQMHGFWYFEAERSFRQVAAFDPECGMAYWGMARANTKNETRARGFIAQALKCKDKASETERRLIEALNTQLEEKVDGKTVLKKKRLETYAKTLEEISLDFPNEIELKALLALQLWENEKEGVPIQSRQAIEAILNQIFAINPRHPAHHFVIHLWDNSRRSMALKSAAACGPAAPGIAHMWHMPGHTYSGLHRYHDAAWQQEASTRVDHAHMIRDRVMPDQIHNFAHNNEWLIRTWIKTGEVDKAMALAKNMCQLPRHPKYNTLDKGSAMYGRNRLISVLTTYGLWEQYLDLAETPYLEPTDAVTRQDERLAWLSVAAWMCEKKELAESSQAQLLERNRLAQAEFSKLTAELQAIDSAKPPSKPTGKETARSTSAAKLVRTPTLQLPIELDKDDWNEVQPKKAESGGKEIAWDDTATKNWTKPQQSKAKEHKKLKTRLDKLKSYVSLAESYHAASQQRFGDAIASARNADALVPVLDRIEWYFKAGRTETALAKCRERIKASPGEVLPAAIGAWIAWQADDSKMSKKWLEELAKSAQAADFDLPQLARLKPIIDTLELASEFGGVAKDADDIGQRPTLDSLGPARWSPYLAPTWSLVDAKGETFSSKQIQGKTTILIFYLGFGCLHCVEQLQAFSPMVEQFKQAGIEVMAVSTESQPSLQSALKNYDETMDVPLMSNSELDLFKSMRCYDDFEDQPLHGTFVLDRLGRVVWQDIGPNPFMDAKFLLVEAIRLNALSNVDLGTVHY